MNVKKFVELKAYNTGEYLYLYVYYKERKNALKINTGYKYEPDKMTEDLYFKDDAHANGLIRQLKDAVSGYITNCYVYKKDINQKDCKIYLKRHFDDNIRIREDGNSQQKQILEYFTDFVNLKALELNNYNSQRVYNNLLKNLKEFDNEYRMTFESVNNIEFFYKFRNYSVETLDHIDNTISKNVAILKAFLKHLQSTEVYNFKSALFDFSISKTPAQVVTLNAAEIQEIFYCNKYDRFEKRLIDVFMFLCMTSIRYSDYEELSKATIENNILTKVNKKTKTDITVPLNQTAIDILQKYEYQLPMFTNAYFNRELKQIFKRHNLLNTPYKKTSIQDKKSIVKEGLKREFITVHKSRSSFITLMITSNTALTEIMSITGHKQVSTLNNYTDRRINPDVTKRINISRGTKSKSQQKSNTKKQHKKTSAQK
jgi:integrase